MLITLLKPATGKIAPPKAQRAKQEIANPAHPDRLPTEPASMETENIPVEIQVPMSESSMNIAAKPLRPDAAAVAIGLACLLGGIFTLLFLAYMPLMPSLAGARDYVVYWSTGQQLAHHANPYDWQSMGRIEHAAGFTGKGSFFMRNPPWSLWLTLPLGYGPVIWMALPWSALMMAIQIFCIHLLKRMLGHRDHDLWLLAYCFPPALLCVLMGQTSLFLLLGFTLFLHLHRDRPFWAGAALWFCAMKPHVLLPWFLCLFLWIFVTRNYKILWGGLTAWVASIGIMQLLHPSIWSEYLTWARISRIETETIPCVAVYLRDAIRPEAKWIAFVPALLAMAWAARYFWQRRAAWNWMDQGNVVLLVSLFAAPYCWSYDQSLALPAILFVGLRVRNRRWLTLLAVACAQIELQLYFGAKLESAYFLWLAAFWGVWFWAVRRGLVSSAEPNANLCAQASA